MGEKFAANPVTGTGSMTVPIALSPGRSGFGPQLSLSYDSGAGNGPFGFGWSLSIPSITRKTDKGLPRYQDAGESDVFILSGAEDLVPILVEGNRQWKSPAPITRTVDGVEYGIQRYRPRIEGLFARIEHWTRQGDGDTHWRSISKDNVTTIYGKTDPPDENSRPRVTPRIADPADEARVFSWLICESYDDKGNAIRYEYVQEDERDDPPDVDLSQAHESNRTNKSRSANRYLKRIKYGNSTPREPGEDMSHRTDWMFEIVFDYGEHDPDEPTPNDGGEWLCRHDPFSLYRAGFEVRTYRSCQRVLMFHHFPDEEEVGKDCLVRSTDFVYRHIRDNAEDLKKGHPIASFIASVTQSGYKRRPQGGYLKKSLPPTEFEYSQATIQEELREVEPESLENLPYGLDGTRYQWVDLDGEGLSGILTEQAGAWFYKRNLSPSLVGTSNGENGEEPVAHFGPLETVTQIPSLAEDNGGGHQFLDLAGDGSLDFVQFNDPMPGFYERSEDAGWGTFTPFASLPKVNWDDPNLKFLDLTGDGHADVLITEDEAFTWYPSLAEAGFGPAERARQALDEEKGPRLVFADGTQSVYLADLSGDGLTDLVRIGNGEVCYWPNLGYGRFGSRVTMDNSPLFDTLNLFDQRRIHLADIDGSGITDIIYLGRDGVHLYFNQSGNSWSEAHTLSQFPHIDNLSAVTAVDLLGNGTACLVWSSPSPGDARRPMRYIDLMGEGKPHLLVKVVNNLGVETHLRYAPSTRFYLKDKLGGKPWATKLPFPVHVVERVETYDWISRNRFVTRYAYHQGYFDGEEREFRGFGMVEEWDTEEYIALGASDDFATVDNIDAASHVPPVHTKTWFHTGLYLGRDHISNFFAGLLDANDKGEYYREPAWQDDEDEAGEHLLEDTILPDGLTAEEEREACRALKGSMLRQEVYALDGTGTEDYPSGHPYAVTEQNFTIQQLQPRAGNRHAVFFTHAREAINYHYERNPDDPRTSHALTLEVDRFGNTLRSLAISYPRANVPERKPEQNETHLTLTLDRFANRDDQEDWYRAGLPVETRTYEVVKPPLATQRFTWKELSDIVTVLVPSNRHEPPLANMIPYESWDWRKQWNPQTEPGGLVDGDLVNTRLRLIEHVRTLYRKNNLTELLPLGTVESLALPGESYKLALTAGLLTEVYGAHVTDAMLSDEGKYVHSEGDNKWWIPSGRVFYSHDAGHPASQELAESSEHFFLPRRFRDPFGNDTFIAYDDYDLLPLETKDALGNKVTAGERHSHPDGSETRVPRIDYRVLQPRLITDPNRNRTEVAFDTLGMLVGTAVKGKDDSVGDTLVGFEPDLAKAEVEGFYDATDPRVPAPGLLEGATTRIIYDLDRFRRTRQAHPEDQTQWHPVYAATLARETHVGDLLPSQGLEIQVSFSYSDGFGRKIQKKIQAEPGPVVEGGPDVDPRWVGSGWTIFNDKGKPVRQYEPFFDDTHHFRFGNKVGVSPVLFYDPVERVVATLHPNHTWEKVVFDPWQQTTYDLNDTVTLDPKTDPDVGGFFSRLLDAEYLPTWHEQRIMGARGAEEKSAAEKAAKHADTPTVAHFDTLGRPFLTVAHNKFERNDATTDEKYESRVELDIEGNQRTVRDAKKASPTDPGRIAIRYDYDILGNRIHQASMEAGERWMLNDVTGKPIRAWDSRGFLRRMAYDELRRPTGLFVTENGVERLAERTVYGESLGDAGNHRTRVHKVFDGAGIVTSEAYDFKGNLLRGRRELLPDYKQAVDWRENAVPDDGTFTSSTSYDALDRPLTVTTPDDSVYRPTFNEANLLDRVEVNLRGEEENGQLKWTTFVTNIDYDAKGQRELITYGNGAMTAYQYDPLTFRLTNLRTTRLAGLNGLASQIFKDPAVVQGLRYTYDPAGNITWIEDGALKEIFNNGQQVKPVCEYTYDATYRLIEGKGREHIGQTASDFDPPGGNRRDFPFFGLRAHPNDAQAMRNYTEHYEYDEVGNFESLRHATNSGGWNRSYFYEEDSLLEPVPRKSNRLTRTTVNGHTETYRYTDALGKDVHGCMTAINTMKMVWDFEDQLQQVDLGGGGKAYYVYDAAGQRVRKVIETQNGTRKQERIYLGGFEVYREYENAGDTVKLERESLHIMDDKQRIVLVETKTIDDGNAIDSPVPVGRYQLANHLGSASLEMDEDAALVSYEEYHPYGTTAYQAVASGAEVSLKRYRYTGKERDEESGFYYHGARYYAPWLGRWVSCDPIGIGDGVNVYAYVRGNPVTLMDPSGRASVLNLLAEDMQAQREQELKERADDVYNVEQVSKEEVADALTLTNGQMIEKYGWTRRNQISDAANKMSGKDLARALPSQDKTVYLQPSGRQATNAQERATVTTEKTTNFDPGTPIGGVARVAARGVAAAVGASPENTELAVGVAGAVGDVANRGLASKGSATRGIGASVPDTRPKQWGAPIANTPATPPPAAAPPAAPAGGASLPASTALVYNPGWAPISGILRDASRVHHGNAGIGTATLSQTVEAGRAWAGEGYSISKASGQQIFVSADKLRQFRVPTFKPRQGIYQANFEQRSLPKGKWEGNAHVEITKP